MHLYIQLNYFDFTCLAVLFGAHSIFKDFSSKSTVNLAVALAKTCQLKVGLLDADIYGPSIPTMMSLHGKPEVSEGVVHLFSLIIYVC